MNEASGAVPARHRVRLAAALGAVACLLVLSAGCSNLGSSSGSTRACSDVVARAVSSGVSTPGTWKCLSPALQAKLQAYGLSGDAAFKYNGSKVIAVTYLGHASGVDTYVVVVGTQPARTFVLVVWVDSDGRVSNIGVGSPAF
jgi:hypothetical protein